MLSELVIKLVKIMAICFWIFSAAMWIRAAYVKVNSAAEWDVPNKKQRKETKSILSEIKFIVMKQPEPDSLSESVKQSAKYNYYAAIGAAIASICSLIDYTLN